MEDPAAAAPEEDAADDSAGAGAAARTTPSPPAETGTTPTRSLRQGTRKEYAVPGRGAPFATRDEKRHGSAASQGQGGEGEGRPAAAQEA